MCNSIAEFDDNVHDERVEGSESVTFVYKRDSRWDVATLDGYDGWSDEELIVKKHKAWTKYSTTVILPSEAFALYLKEGIRFYAIDGGLMLVRLDQTAAVPDMDGRDDIFVKDGENWTNLRKLLEAHSPKLPHCADLVLLSLMVAGKIRLWGYYNCADAAEPRHVSRGIGVFMDCPLHVLGFKVPESTVTNRNDYRDCLIIPVGPACTIVMRYMTEKYSIIYGRVHHSERVIVLPFGCRLGDRKHLKWYAVGAGAWELSNDPPTSLVELTERELNKLQCSISSSDRDCLSVSAKKGVSSLRLRDISVEAGWSGMSPHLVITGVGKRITTTIKTHSLTQLVEVLRRIRDKWRLNLSYSIQEIAALVVLNEVLIGALLITQQQGGMKWIPRWNEVDTKLEGCRTGRVHDRTCDLHATWGRRARN